MTAHGVRVLGLDRGDTPPHVVTVPNATKPHTLTWDSGKLCMCVFHNSEVHVHTEK